MFVYYPRWDGKGLTIADANEGKIHTENRQFGRCYQAHNVAAMFGKWTWEAEQPHQLLALPKLWCCNSSAAVSGSSSSGMSIYQTAITPLDDSTDMPTDESSSGIRSKIVLGPSNKRIHCLIYPWWYRKCFGKHAGTWHGATARAGAWWSSIKKQGLCFSSLPFCLLIPVKTILFIKTQCLKSKQVCNFLPIKYLAN